MPYNVRIASDPWPSSILVFKIPIISALYLSLEFTFIVVANPLELIGLEEAHDTNINFDILLFAFKGYFSFKKSVRDAWVLAPYGIVRAIGPRVRWDYEDHVLAPQPLLNCSKYYTDSKREWWIQDHEFKIGPLILKHIKTIYWCPIGLMATGIKVSSYRTKKPSCYIFNQDTFGFMLVLCYRFFAQVLSCFS